jgi:hypothetical protein
LANCQRSYWGINGVNDTGNACIAGVIDTGKVGDIYYPVSMTPVMHVFNGVNDTGEAREKSNIFVNIRMHACIAGVVDTVDAPVRPLAVRQCL